jgi:hypothetical protein
MPRANAAGLFFASRKERAMIIDTPDDRRLEVLHIKRGLVYMCIEDQHGNQETIILDTEQKEQLLFYLAMPTGEV